MSDKYINKEDAIQSIIAHDIVGGNARGWAEYLLEYTSAVDVAPVRHAKWEGCKGDITCSACGEYALYDSEDIEMQYRTLYCPFCGARMDGEK